MGGISYKETLELVEKFMIDSHIRKYCSEICRGRCCENCYDKNPQSCRHCEGRRLPCSIFLCGDILYLFSVTDTRLLKWINKSIKEQYHIYSKIRCAYVNIYFTRPDKAFIKIARFPKKIGLVVPDLNVIEIRSIMDELIKTKTKIHNAYEYKNRRRKDDTIKLR